MTSSIFPHCLKREGTAETTVQVDSLPEFVAGWTQTALDGKLYFVSYDQQQFGVWTYDPGTDASTRISGDYRPFTNRNRLEVAGGKLFFSGSDLQRVNYNLWEIDPTTNSASPVTEFQGYNGTGPIGLTPALGTLFFAGDDNRTGREPWKLLDTEVPGVLPDEVVSGGSSVIVISRDGDDLIVDDGSPEPLRYALGTIAGITVRGTAASETFQVDISNLSRSYLPCGITIVAGEETGDNDSVVLLEAGTIINEIYTSTGDESGVFDLDGLDIEFSEVESATIYDRLHALNRTFTSWLCRKPGYHAT